MEGLTESYLMSLYSFFLIQVLFLDCGKTYNEIVASAKAFFGQAGFSKAVLGLSGGLDSALAACILAEAIGKENVTCLLMPDSKVNRKQDLDDAVELAKWLGVECRQVPVDILVEAVEKSVQWKQSRAAKTNLRARARTVLLYDFANSNKALVVGTGNKSEIMLGYFTKFGDGAADFFPLQNLFKTEVFELAKFKALPKAIIEKKPSAGLEKGQTDEKELGAGYAEIDSVLKEIEKGESEEKLKQKFGELAISLLQRINANKHKQR